jgi:hypothetical protein
MKGRFAMKRRLPWIVRFGIVAVVVITAAILWRNDIFSRPAVAQVQFGARPAGLTWTRLPDNGDLIVSCSKVPGGWFVALYSRGINPGGLGTLDGAFFYPDPLHEWNGSSMP